MAKKVKEDTLNLEAILFKCRDILRQAKNSGSFFEKREQAILDHLQHFLMLNNLCLILIKGSLETDINRIKVVLVEQRRTNKWLADTLGKDCTTVSKWCTNTAQPGLETLVKIAECLNVDARELLFLQKSNFKPIMKKL